MKEFTYKDFLKALPDNYPRGFISKVLEGYHRGALIKYLKEENVYVETMKTACAAYESVSGKYVTPETFGFALRCLYAADDASSSRGLEAMQEVVENFLRNIQSPQEVL